MRCGLEKKPALIFDRKHLLLARITYHVRTSATVFSFRGEPPVFLSFPLHIPSLLPSPRPTSNGQCKQTWSEQTPRDGEEPGESTLCEPFPPTIPLPSAPSATWESRATSHVAIKG